MCYSLSDRNYLIIVSNDTRLYDILEEYTSIDNIDLYLLRKLDTDNLIVDN